MDLQIRETKHELKINWDPRLNQVSRNMKQGQIPLQHIEFKTFQSLFVLEFCILKVTLVKNYLLKLAIIANTPIVIVCWNGLWPEADTQEKEGACLASIKQFLSNNKSIPSLPPSLCSKEIKKMTVRKPSHQEKHRVSNMQQVNETVNTSVCL